MTNKTIIIAVLAAVLAGCGNKQETTQQQESVVGEFTQKMFDGVNRMEDYNYSDTVMWRGSCYTYNIKRTACDSLGIVTDDDGLQFVENIVTLTVKRDGNALFSRTFTKDMFADYVPADFMARSVAEGIAFSKAADDGLRFTMAIGTPISDEYVQLRLTIAASGQLKVKRDEIVDDTLADDDSMYVEF